MTLVGYEKCYVHGTDDSQGFTSINKMCMHQNFLNMH